jgi:hypothetical protein
MCTRILGDEQTRAAFMPGGAFWRPITCLFRLDTSPLPIGQLRRRVAQTGCPSLAPNTCWSKRK